MSAEPSAPATAATAGASASAGSAARGATAAAPRRRLRLRVFRYDPRDPESTPHFQTYEIEEGPGMTVFLALTEIRERQDPTLAFDFVCRAGICGSCSMLVNGRPKLACRTLTQELPEEMTLAPLPVFELIADLSVNTGKWMRGMVERLEAWVKIKEAEIDASKFEEKMDPDLADRIYELDRCIECGCCVAACGTAHMRADFVGAVGMNRVARFRMDPRDVRSDDDWYDVIGDDQGVFGCMTLLGCQDACPKNLPLQTQIAYLRRRMVKAGLMK